MNEVQTLALYAGAVLSGALVGEAPPIIGRVRRSDAFLSFSAGVMLGTACLHMLPEAARGAGLAVIPAVLAGFLFLFLLERLVLARFTGGQGGSPEGSPALAVSTGCADGAPGRGTPCCAAHTTGLAAFVGLSLHTVVDGFALGAASSQRVLGFLVFLAIMAHNVPVSFSLSSILRADGYSRRRSTILTVSFALMVPLGAALYVAIKDLVRTETFTALALAGSAGTFLHLALTDILPDVFRRNDSRLKLSAALTGGVGVMWALLLFIG